MFFCIYEEARLLVSSGEYQPALKQGVGAFAGASLICSDTSKLTRQRSAANVLMPQDTFRGFVKSATLLDRKGILILDRNTWR